MQFNYTNVISYLIISYFCAVLFPVDFVTIRAILKVARRASSRLFSRIFLRDWYGLLPRTVFVLLLFTVFRTMNVSTNNFKIATYNCHGLKSSVQYDLELDESHDILFLNEHWLQIHELFTIEQM